MEVLSYSCVSCKKDYGTYKNLWAHNKRHHNGIKTVKDAYKPDENDILSFKCRKCNNMFKHTQSRHTHEKTCGGILRTEIDLEFEKCRSINLVQEKENLDKEKENLDKEKEILELKIKLQGIERENKEEKEEQKQEFQEEKRRTEKNKRETRIKLRSFLLDLNQARIQSKF